MGKNASRHAKPLKNTVITRNKTQNYNCLCIETIATHRANALKKIITNGNKAQILDFLQKENVDVSTVQSNGDTVLHLILRKINCTPQEIIEILDILLAKDIDPNIQNVQNETVLLLAVRKRDPYIIDFLLKHNAKTDISDDRGNSVIHVFIENETKYFLKITEFTPSKKRDIENKSIRYVEYLMSRGFDFDIENKSGQSPLHWAIGYNLQHILPTLLKRTKNIHFVSRFGNQTLLQLFIKSSKEAENHLNNSNNLNDFSPEKTAGIVFIPKYKVWSDTFPQGYAIEIIKILLERGVSVDNIDKNGLTAIHMAMYAGEEMDILQMLLQRFSRVRDKCGIELLFEVTKQATWEPPYVKYYSKILRILLAKGADIDCRDDDGMTPIHHAIKRWNFYVAKILKDNGANFNAVTKDGRNLFFWLFRKPKWDHKLVENTQEILFDFLVSGGCNVNSNDIQGRSPLYVAISKAQDITIVKKLLLHGANVSCREKFRRRTPLHEAVELQLFDTTKLLLSYGAKINSKDVFQHSPLYFAVKKGFVEMIELLLNRGADVNSRGDYGYRLLHVATMMCINREEILKILLRRGAWVNARDDKGESALDKAIQLSHNDSVKLLLMNGAEIKDDRNIVNMMCDEKFYDNYLKEIAALKKIFIDKRTSMYDWMNLHPIRHCIYSNNRELKNLTHSSVFVKEFPLYSKLIVRLYRKAETRKSLTELAKCALMNFGRVYLPDICSENIFDYLDDGDLISIIDLQQ